MLSILISRTNRLLGKLYNVQTRLSIVCYTGLAIVAILLMASVEGKGMDAVFYILFVLQLVHTTIELIYAITISIPVSLFWDCVLVIPSEETGRFTNAFLTFTASKTRQLVLTDLQTRLLGARQEVGFKFSVMLYRSEWYRNNVSYTCLLSVFALTYYVVCMALGEPTSGPFYARMAFIYLLVGIAAIIVLWCAGAIVYCVLGLLDKLLLCGRVSKYLTQRKMNYINKLLEAQDLDALVRPGMVVWNKNESLFG